MHILSITSRLHLARREDRPRKVVYAKAFTHHAVELHIETPERLRPMHYPAVYVTDTESLVGSYTVVVYESVGDLWLFKGVFDAMDGSAPIP